jgi:hypothetical protein
VYLRRFTRWPADCNPYALEVVQFADIDQAHYYTMSVRGITHYIDGVNAEFASACVRTNLMRGLPACHTLIDPWAECQHVPSGTVCRQPACGVRLVLLWCCWESQFVLLYSCV